MNHPEDTIYKYATHILEFSKIQDRYYEDLIDALPKLTKRGEDLLFDYIYNSYDRYEDFEDYFSHLDYETTQIYDSQS